MTDTQDGAPATAGVKAAVVPAATVPGGPLYRVIRPGHGYSIGATISDQSEIKKHGSAIRLFAVPVGSV
ncbi:hypothetical protein [Acetobacter malorum]|uniref:Uncharacterized protein n=1 Tax=Acetobacter malorum TaxID=178901 RepID=A0A1Y3GAN4_9PROT|nr:hypothetical protein [Acetobacter malorum]OUJ06647.1 hypothetical protein HK23_14315 [Acetobacter malorum]